MSDNEHVKNNSTGSVYFMAAVGAVVYFVRHAMTFGAGVLGVIKGVFWPAVLMYKLLEWLKM